ncbi:MAG TPA: GNAT family protein [Actinomycetota bacterium]|nr:GNAT family protein [Actinomycetota bacterium]
MTIELRGDAVTLRAFRPDEYGMALARLPGDARDPEKARIRRMRVERSGTRTSVELFMVVEAGGKLVGDVQGRSVEMAMPPGVWEIGIELWNEPDRGRGHGREAVALLTSHLFEGENAHRVQASTDVGNAAMRRVLEALGFTDEGTLRGFMPNGGGPPRDYEMYAVTKEDWTRKH